MLIPDFSIVVVMPEWLIFISKSAVVAAVRASIPKVRRLWAQRRVAGGQSRADGDRIADVLTETIGGLTGRRAFPAWWRGALAKAEQTAIAPLDTFRGSSLHAWLDDGEVRRSLRELLILRLNGRPGQDASEAPWHACLSDKYEGLVGDAGAQAQDRVEVVLAVALVGAQSDLAASPAAQALALQQQADTERILDATEALAKAMGGAVPFGGEPRVSILPGGEDGRDPPTFPPAIDADAVSRAFGSASRRLLGWPQGIGGQWVDRPELEQLYALVTDAGPRVAVLLGGPGVGKSALLARLGERLVAEGVVLLAIKADEVPKDVGTLAGLDGWIGAGVPVTVALRRLAEDRRVVLLVDQLDALADLMDQHGQRLSALLRLVDEVRGTPNLHVIASCREFELRNDVRLASLKAEEVRLRRPSWEQMLPLLTARGIDTKDWTGEVREVVRTPQHLAVFLEHHAGGASPPTFGSYQALLDAVLREGVEKRFGARTMEAAERVALEMAREEELTIGRARFDADFRQELLNLEAAGVLAFSGDRLRVMFRHQTVFDFVRARAFLRGGVSIAAYVLQEKQESLFVRPVLWSALGYLRRSDPAAYRREFHLLWSHDGLRTHLLFLLVAFLGQTADPDDQEARWLLPMLDRPAMRPRALRAMAGGPGWLERVRSRLPELMAVPPDEAWTVLPLLRKAVASKREATLALVERLWVPDPAYHAHALQVLEEVQVWDGRAVALANRLAAGSGIATVFVNHLASRVGQTRPNLAVSIVVGRLWAELGRLKSEETSGVDVGAGLLEPDFDPDDIEVLRPSSALGRARRAAAVLNQTGEWHNLDKWVTKAPQAFLEAAWAWLVEVLEANAGDPGGRPDCYRPEVGLGSFRTVGRPQGDLASAFEGAAKAFAEDDPDAYLDFVAAKQGSDLMATHRLLAAGLERVAAARPSAVLDYLAADPRRLAIGGHSDPQAETAALIAAAAPAMDEAQAARLERAVLEWTPEGRAQRCDIPEERHAIRQRTRLLRLRLLRAFPSDKLTPVGSRHRERDERELGDALPTDGGTTVCGFVESPMKAAQMAAVADEEILGLFEELTDGTGWHHPSLGRTALIGGSVQAAREFAAFAKDHPERALRIMERFRPGRQERPLGNALTELGGVAAVPPQRLVACVHRMDAAGFNTEEFRSGAARCLGEVAHRAGGLNDETCSLLESWLQDWTSPLPDPGLPRRSGRQRSGTEESARRQSLLWDTGGLTLMPSGNYLILEAITLGYLARRPHGADGWLEVLRRHLQRPENPQVWIGLAHHLQHLRHANRARVVAWVSDLFRKVPALLHSWQGVQLVAHLDEFGGPGIVAQAIEDWSTSGWAEGHLAIGEITALRFCRGTEDAERRAELAAVLDGAGHSTEDAATMRLGAAHTLVEAWRESQLRPRVTPLLTELVPSADAATGAALKAAFLKVDPLPADTWTDQLLRAFIHSPVLLTSGGGHFMLTRLKDLLRAGGSPDLVCAAVRAFVERAGPGLNDARTAWAGQAGDLVELALTLHRLPETRASGLRLFERLLELETLGAEARLSGLDRRSPI